MQRDDGAPGWRGTAFGLEIAAAQAVPGIGVCAPGTQQRLVEWRQLSASAFDDAAAASAWSSLVDLRHDDGVLFLSVEQAEGVGFRISAPGFGRHLVSEHGRTLLSHLGPNCKPGWERLFFAQPLPLAAALQGLELVHASAVVIERGAVALVAASGTGKTSVAAHLVAGGATFLTDDVLALEASDGLVLAHPGPARLAIDEAELGKLSKDVGAVVGRSDKLHLALEPAAEAVPLRAVYFLHRSLEGHGPLFAPVDDARPLLASSFLGYLTSSERLLVHLDICARIAAGVPTVDVAIPPGVSAQDVARALHAHTRALEPAWA
jgi:hypothetical protein